jgi:SnoaL-like polyketide cyclase
MAFDPASLRDFATRYTAAWCSQNASSVAAFYSPQGSLGVNGGTPALGRKAITETVQGYMTAFPDLQVLLDDASAQGDGVVYSWTLIGTNTGTRWDWAPGAHQWLRDVEHRRGRTDRSVPGSLRQRRLSAPA